MGRLGHSESSALAENAQNLHGTVLTMSPLQFLKLVTDLLGTVKQPRSWLAVPFFILMSTKTGLRYDIWTPKPDTELVVPFRTYVVVTGSA